MNLFDRILGFDRWTTDRVLSICRDLPDADLDREFDIGNRTIRRTLDHMLDAIELWTRLMGGETAPPKPERPSVDDLIARHAAAHDCFAAIVREVAAAGRLDETFTDHHGVRQSYGATILQVNWHNTLHRGEVLHMLQRLGVPDLPDGDPQEWEHLTGRV